MPSIAPRSFVDVLVQRAAERPRARAFAFLHDGEAEGPELTYGELDERARALAVELTAAAPPASRALIACHGGPDYVIALFGCFYAGMVAVPAHPPEPRRLELETSRLDAIAADARPSVVLSSSELARMHSSRIGGTDAPVIAVDTISVAAAGAWRALAVEPSSLAILQYTSGSTTAPRGVMLTHANLLSNVEMIRDAFGHDDALVGVCWLPLFHDMGLVGSVLQPVFCGGSCVFLDPAAFIRHPIRWLSAISRHRATTSGGPSFAFDLCVQRVRDDQLAALDLSSWRVAYCGAERVRADVLLRFAERFSGAGFDPAAFLPCYGLAEATLFVSGSRRAAPPTPGSFDRSALEDGVVRRVPPGPSAIELVGCGNAHPGETLAIVDPKTHEPCPAGRVGEIWIAGPNVGAGYFEHASSDAHAFGATLADDAGAGPFLRTGDLGFLDGTELYVTDRIKDLVIIAGQNHSPDDIEEAVRACDPLLAHGVAAFSVDSDRGERLAIVAEIAGHQPSAVLDRCLKSIRRAVSDAHGIAAGEVWLVRRGGIPRTSSGKVQRSACRRLLGEGRLPALATWPSRAGTA